MPSPAEASCCAGRASRRRACPRGTPRTRWLRRPPPAGGRLGRWCRSRPGRAGPRWPGPRLELEWRAQWSTTARAGTRRRTRGGTWADPARGSAGFYSRAVRSRQPARPFNCHRLSCAFSGHRASIRARAARPDRFSGLRGMPALTAGVRRAASSTALSLGRSYEIENGAMVHRPRSRCARWRRPVTRRSVRAGWPDRHRRAGRGAARRHGDGHVAVADRRADDRHAGRRALHVPRPAVGHLQARVRSDRLQEIRARQHRRRPRPDDLVRRADGGRRPHREHHGDRRLAARRRRRRRRSART